jgi:hypothetical protein
MPERKAETKYCEDCGHAIDRHERSKDRTYVCNFYGCACKTSKLRVKREGGEK